MKGKRFAIAGAILLSLTVLLNANAQNAKTDAAQVHAFVQKFYDWYEVLYDAPVSKKNPESTDVKAIKQKPQYFDFLLSKALFDDYKEQAKVKGDIVGLDFDPFLAAQDNGFKYEAGNVKQVAGKFLVDIHRTPISKSKKEILNSEVAVIAEVTKVNNRWMFTNFIYPAEGKQKESNVIQILANLRQDREQQKNKR